MLISSMGLRAWLATAGGSMNDLLMIEIRIGESIFWQTKKFDVKNDSHIQ